MTNESAERLLAQIAWRDPATKKVALPRLRRELDEALAAERRSTVERIRATVRANSVTIPEIGSQISAWLDAILDAEAQR